MLERNEMKRVVKANIDWFLNSGIMDPPDGAWGVAERIVITKNNESMEKIYKIFSSYVEYDDYMILEHRRPDCNFETALMFVLASMIFNENKYRTVAENILRYLYCRSGMRRPDDGGMDYPLDSWKWSHDRWDVPVWLDDNAWNCVIPLIISKLEPEFERAFNLKASSLNLASNMQSEFNRQFVSGNDRGETSKWKGDLQSPHWGSLVVMAMAFAYSETRDEKYKESILQYEKYLLLNQGRFSASEDAYVIIGSSVAASALNNDEILNTAEIYADIVLSKMDTDTGNIPSEWSKEAPTGKHLVDLIYTQNWGLLGLHTLSALTSNPKYSLAFPKAMNLVVNIQDKSPEPYLKGCWRGMYDLNRRAWGGGDRHEGGANSIYSGWTNAPITIIIASFILDKSYFIP